MGKIDIAYYTKETVLISKNLPSIAFYIIIKGSVAEYIENELHNVYSEGDSFDGDALIYGSTSGKFIVEEDLICYEIKKDDFLELLQDKRVQSYFLQDFVTRHQHLKEYDAGGDMTPFLMSRVSDIFLHKACVVVPTLSIYEALKKQVEYKSSVIIVKREGEYFIVTDTDLKERVLLADRDVHSSINDIADRPIVSIDINDFLFNALLLMTHKEIKRLVVMQNDRVAGILEQIDLLSYFANHSHLVAVQVDRATTIEDLKHIQEDVKNIIVLLRAKGVKLRYITKLVSTLNLKIYKKVFNMVMPKELQDRCALMVMGSEGRFEQALKTDQDNALIIKEGEELELFKEPMMRLNEMLLELGFPKCSGNVMVSNDFYRQHLESYKRVVDDLVNSLEEKHLQKLSIFLDASCVCGECGLVDELRTYIFKRFAARDDVLAHMAKAVLNFDTPLSLFSGFVLQKSHNNKLDLKKGGIFAIVHGVRVLALKHGIMQTNTIERIKELNNHGVIDKNFAKELIESFDTLSTIRLKAMLESKDLSEVNYINPNSLEKIQRDLLKDSFKIVNKFKKFMSFHFHLEMVL